MASARARVVRRGTALEHRGRRPDEGEHERDGDDAEQATQPSGRPPLLHDVGVARRAAGVEQAALAVGEHRLMALDGLERGGEPGAAVQLARLAPAGLPRLRGRVEVAAQREPLAVVVEPRLQARPAHQECLVGHLDRRFAGGRVAVERQEPVARRRRR